MAVGVLMHRYSLSRGEAIERLLRQAADAKRSPRAEAELRAGRGRAARRPGAALGPVLVDAVRASQWRGGPSGSEK